MEFDGRNVLLTGVGRPGQVGEAVAQAFARRGARLLLVAHRIEQARERADALVAGGRQATPFAADLTDVGAVASLADDVRTRTGGRLHALVHVAGGFSMSGPVAGSDPAEWTRLFAMNGTTAHLVSGLLHHASVLDHRATDTHKAAPLQPWDVPVRRPGTEEYLTPGEEL